MAAVFQALYQTFMGAQTEILFFVIALCAHVLLFGKYRIIGPAKKAKSGKVDHECRPKQASRGTLLDVRSITSLVRQHASKDALAEALESQLKANTASKAEACQALVEVLDRDAKASSEALLGAVRDVVSSGAASLDSHLAEALLKGYLALGKLEDFERVLATAEDAGEVQANIAVLAVRASMSSSNFGRTLKCLRRFAPVLQEGLKATPSTAPHGLYQALIRLAGQSGELPALVRELHGCSLLSDSGLEAVLAACIKGQHLAALQDIETFCRSKSFGFSPSAYGWLIQGTREPEKAMRLLAEAAGSGPAEQGLLLAAATVAVARGDAALARGILERLPTQPGPELALVALRLHAKTPREDSDGAVLGLFERGAASADVLADAAASQVVAEAAIRLGRTDLLAQLLAAAPAGPRHVALLKRVSAGRDGLKVAQEIFAASPDKRTYLYNALLDICIDGQDMEAAEKLMSEAVSVGMADVVTYNTLIKKLLRCGELDKARGVIEAMRAAGGSLLPNTVTFNEFIDAVIRDNTVAAWQLVDEMKACGLKPTGITASILLKSVQKNCKDGELERCMALADTLEDEMDEVLLSSLCEACIRADRADLLRKPLRRHRSGKTAPITGAITFGSLIRAYGFVQDLEGARRVWREMRQLKIVPTSITIGCMVEALASNGDIEGGHQLIRELLTDPETRSLVNSVMYGSLLKGFSQQKYFSRVWELYAEMVSENLECTLVTYNVLINVCVRSGDCTRIPGLLEDMARNGIEPSIITYSTVLKAYCYENCMDKAFEMFDELKRSRQYTPDEIIYNTMLDGCARSCLYERGISVLKDMEKGRVKPSAFTLSLLVKLAHRCDRVDKAFELCSEISRKYRIQQNVHVYNNLIAACTSSGNTQWAFDVLQEMLHAKVKPDVRTYTLLLRGCLYNYELQDAAGLVRAASGLRGAHPRTAGCSSAVYRLPGGLPGELLSEVLQRIAGHGGDEVLAVQLLRELKGMPGATVGPGLPYWLTSKVLKGA